MNLGAQPLPTIAGPLRPIGPVLERELALVFERAPAGTLAEAIISWAFDRGLVVRSSIDETIAHVIVGRGGASRAARVASPPARRPAKTPRGSEWTAATPAKRRT